MKVTNAQIAMESRQLHGASRSVPCTLQYPNKSHRASLQPASWSRMRRFLGEAVFVSDTYCGRHCWRGEKLRDRHHAHSPNTHTFFNIRWSNSFAQAYDKLRNLFNINDVLV